LGGDATLTISIPGTIVTQHFVPHGQCLLWNAHLLSSYVTADSLIALSYYSIPLLMIYLLFKRRDLPFQKIVLLFGLFILSCGTTHAMDVVTIWYPVYWAAGIVKGVTAVVSVACAIALIFAVPQILVFPTWSRLEDANRELEREVKERRRAEKRFRDLLEAAPARFSSVTAAALSSSSTIRPSGCSATRARSWLASRSNCCCRIGFATVTLRNARNI